MHFVYKFWQVSIIYELRTTGCLFFCNDKLSLIEKMAWYQKATSQYN